MTERMKDHLGRTVRQFDKERFRIAAFDLDETLIPSFGLIPGPEKEALHALSASGVYVSTASGRNLTQIYEETLDHFRFLVLLNGAYIQDRLNGELLYTAEMDRKKAAEMAGILESFGGVPVLYQGARQTTCEAVKKVRSWGTKDYRDGNREVVYEAFEKPSVIVPSAASYIPDGDPVYKMHTIFIDPAYQEKAYEAISHIEGFTVLKMTNGDLEITKAGVSKATGLELLAKTLGLSLQNVVTFGDSLNDLEMMKASGYSVAMGNADAFLFDIADYVTDTCENDGAAKAVKALYGV